MINLSALLGAAAAADRQRRARDFEEPMGAGISNIYRAGDKAPSSGLYTAIHKEHGSAHEVIVLYGEVFPDCVQCGSAVLFALAELSVHVYAHPQFTRGR